MTNLVVLCPSRERPGEAQRVHESFVKASTTDRVKLHFALDHGDPTFSLYPKGSRMYPSHSAVGALNCAATRRGEDYIGFIGDDNRFITTGWDQMVLDALDGMGGGVVYPNDLVIPGSLPSVVFMSRSIVKAVGWFALPTLQINYFDNVWKDLGEMTGHLKYLPDVAVQHLTLPYWSATPEHGERHEAQVKQDRQNYLLWCQTTRAADIVKAKAALA